MVGVSPWISVAKIDGLETLAALARALLPVNAALGPQTTTGLTNRRRTHWIYGRRGSPCPVCRTPLVTADEQQVPWGRVTTWCPMCQGDVPADALHVSTSWRRALALLRRHHHAAEAFRRVAENPGSVVTEPYGESWPPGPAISRRDATPPV